MERQKSMHQVRIVRQRGPPSCVRAHIDTRPPRPLSLFHTTESQALPALDDAFGDVDAADFTPALAPPRTRATVAQSGPTPDNPASKVTPDGGVDAAAAAGGGGATGGALGPPAVAGAGLRMQDGSGMDVPELAVLPDKE